MLLMRVIRLASRPFPIGSLAMAVALALSAACSEDGGASLNPQQAGVSGGGRNGQPPVIGDGDASLNPQQAGVSGDGRDWQPPETGDGDASLDPPQAGVSGGNGDWQTLVTGDGDASVNAPQAGGSGDEGDWRTLVTGDWQLDPRSEDPDRCIKVRVEEDLYIGAIRPIHPPGTHHTFVALSDSADGKECRREVGKATLLYAAGVGTTGLVLPEGVAMKLTAGKVLNLSLHIYNPTDAPLAGTSGMEIQTVRKEDVTAEVGTILSGPLRFQLPAARRTTIQHTCTLTHEGTAIALFPHMHQLGRHIKTTLVRDGGSTVLHDGDFDFEEQLQLPLDPIEFSAGDKVVTDCTFDNSGETTVTFGASSDQEMCFSMLFSYPVADNLCTVGGAQIVEP